MFQYYALFPHLDEFKNVAFGLDMQRLLREEIHSRVDDALTMVRLEKHGSPRPGQLSGGQRQRVALASPLVNRPKVLSLDEPLAPSI